MTAQDGASVLLAVGDGSESEVFSTIGGMRVTQMHLSGRPLDATSRESGAWQQLMPASGPRALAITGRGMFTSSAGENTLRGYALAGSANHYRISFPGGGTISGSFIVTHYERRGEVGLEEEFSLGLESTGEVVYG